MTTVTYDDRSFLIEGQRVWLVSGEVQYFRLPPELWRDRLLKARRGGLNCISTPLAWNVHEPAEGKWRFEDDADIAQFIRLAGDLGLYVILRPGPYIGADWDHGGLPAWLNARSGMTLRTNSAAFTHYLDKYLRQVLARVVDLQVTRGGNIVLIENEHRYRATAMPDRLRYLEFISQLFRRSGFDVPIVTCNELTEPALPDSVECVIGGAGAVAELKRLQIHGGHGPRMVLAYETGGFDAWGGEHTPATPAETARRALMVLGSGAQINYYLFCGGTNFGFRGSRANHCEACYQTTSYDYAAPVAEGGGLSESYYLCRTVNLLGRHMGRFLADCRPPEPQATADDATSVLTLTGPSASWAFVTNGGRDDVETVRVSLPDGRSVTVPMGAVGTAAVCFDMVLDERRRVDLTNVTPLGLFGENTLVLHGPPDWPAEVTVNGTLLAAPVPKGREPKVLEHDDLRIVLISTELASRTWVVDDTLVFGASFVGETLEDIEFGKGVKQVALLPLEGKLTHRKAPSDAVAAGGAAPKLRKWHRLGVCTEPVDDELEWRELPGPRDADSLGAHQGYLWYRLQWDTDRARKRNLFLPQCEDRATVWLNGELIGTWGRGPEAVREPMPAQVRRGANTLVLLADNLGRSNQGRLGEAKGLFGGVYDAKPFRIRKPKPRALDKFPRRVVPRGLNHLLDDLDSAAPWSMDFDLSLSTVTPVHLRFSAVPHHVAVLCNDRPVGFFPCEGENFGDVTLGAGLKKGKNRVRLIGWGEPDAKLADRVELYALSEELGDGQGRWGWRAWERPEAGGPIVGKDQPAWYTTSFGWNGQTGPLFVHVAGARKGQLFLNGRNVGRFWTIGPQEYYYLPASWLGEENELALFVESGDLPRRTRLAVCPLGPYRS